MAQIGRDGHRERMRQSYLNGDMKNAPEHNLLELFLSLVIPRKDVKQLSYDLINEFGSLEGVLMATPIELMSVKGVGESTAVALSLANQFVKKISVDRNAKVTKFKSLDDVFSYCRNLFVNEKTEKIYIITLTANCTIINHYLVGEGTVKSSSIDMPKLFSCISKDKPFSILLTHNHPGGNAHPSVNDLTYTVKLKQLLADMNVGLYDHIIIADDDQVSLKTSKEYSIRL